jgi:hypothetical protein
MNTTPFDTQQIRLDLMQELLQVEEEAIKATEYETDVSILAELGEKIRWLKNKLNFLNSPIYQERKRKAQS